MPGIKELEAALVQYYQLYEDFQGHLYWSAALLQGNQFKQAYATKVTIDANGNVAYLINDSDKLQLRENKLRIRAFYRKN